MTLEDNESRENIINPYITLYSPDEMCWVALNTSTFGEEGQFRLLSIYDEVKQQEYNGNVDLYKVVATVAKQNFMLRFERRSHSRTVRVEGASDPVALVSLGYLLGEDVKRLYPRSFEFFEKQRR